MYDTIAKFYWEFISNGTNPYEGRCCLCLGYMLVYILLQEIARLNEELRKYQDRDKN